MEYRTLWDGVSGALNSAPLLRESRGKKRQWGCVRLAGLVKEPELRWFSTCWKRSARSSPDGNQDRVAVRPGQSQIKTVWCSLTLQPLSWNQAMALRDTQEPAPPTSQKLEFSAAEIGALAHLYRGEVYRSTAWRTRLD